LRADLSADPAFADLLARVREACLGAYAHQDVPFERLVQELAPERDLARAPLFQVMLVLQNAPREALHLPGLTLRPATADAGPARFDLLLGLREGPDGLAGALEYNADIFEAATVDRIAAHLRTLLEGVARAPTQRVSELPIVPEAELHRLLVEWNDTAA